MLSVMTRLALIAAFLAAGWSPLVHCAAAASAAEDAPSCHEEAAPEPAKAPMADCAVMACCQAVLPPAAVASPAPESVLPAFAAAAALILVPPAPAAEFSPSAPPGPPGVLLAASRLGRAPPAA